MYPIISHKGAGAYIRIFKISGFSSLENRTAYRRPELIFLLAKNTYFILCSLISLSGGSMKACVTGKRENKRGKGLEVPCVVTVKMSEHIFTKVEPIIQDLCKRLI